VDEEDAVGHLTPMDEEEGRVSMFGDDQQGVCFDGDNTNMFASDQEEATVDGDDIHMEDTVEPVVEPPVVEDPPPAEDNMDEAVSPARDDVEPDRDVAKVLFDSESESEPEVEPEQAPADAEPEVAEPEDEGDTSSVAQSTQDEESDEDEDYEEEEDEEDAAPPTHQGSKSKPAASLFIDDEAGEEKGAGGDEEDEYDDFGNDPNDYVVRKKDGKTVLVPFIASESDDDEDYDEEEEEIVDGLTREQRFADARARLKAQKPRTKAKRELKELTRRYKMSAEAENDRRLERESQRKKEKKAAAVAVAAPSQKPAAAAATAKKKGKSTSSQKLEGDDATTFANAQAMFAFVVLMRASTSSSERQQLMGQYPALQTAQAATNTLNQLTEKVAASALDMLPDGVLKTIVKMSFEASEISWTAFTGKAPENCTIKLSTAFGTTVNPSSCVVVSLVSKTKSYDSEYDTVTNRIIVPKNIAALLTIAHRVRRLDHMLLDNNTEAWHERCAQAGNFMDVVMEVFDDTDTGESIRAQWDRYQKLLLQTLVKFKSGCGDDTEM